VKKDEGERSAGSFRLVAVRSFLYSPDVHA
jgi:hypothetical protein